jgi:hypothetical protein
MDTDDLQIALIPLHIPCHATAAPRVNQLILSRVDRPIGPLLQSAGKRNDPEGSAVRLGRSSDVKMLTSAQHLHCKQRQLLRYGVPNVPELATLPGALGRSTTRGKHTWGNPLSRGAPSGG